MLRERVPALPVPRRGASPRRAPQGAPVRFEVRVVPGASRCGLVRDGERLRVRIDAPPVDGAANERLIRFLSREVFGVSRSAVRVVAGEKGRNKTIEVDLSDEAGRAALEKALGTG